MSGSSFVMAEEEAHWTSPAANSTPTDWTGECTPRGDCSPEHRSAHVTKAPPTNSTGHNLRLNPAPNTRKSSLSNIVIFRAWNSHPGREEIHAFYGTLKAHYCVHKSPPSPRPCVTFRSYGSVYLLAFCELTDLRSLTTSWRKLLNEELHGLYSSPSIVRVIKARRMRWAGHVARMGEVRGAYKILVGRPKGRRPLGRPSRRWEDNIKMDLREIGFGDVDWIHCAQVGTGGGLLWTR
jgi:hypothetical protein